MDMMLRILDIYRRRDNYSTISTSKMCTILTKMSIMVHFRMSIGIGMQLMIDIIPERPPNATFLTIMNGLRTASCRSLI